MFSTDKERTFQDAAEYLRINVTGLDQEGKVNIFSYGRATKDVRQPFENDIQGRLYYFYLDYRDAFKDHLNFRAGRTYVNAAAVSGTVDGVHLDLKNLGPMGITFFGGRNVIFAEKRETGTMNDAIVGTSVYLDTIKNTHVEVSYGRQYGNDDDDRRLARENVGLDFSTTPISGIANFYGRLKYDTISESYNEILFGTKIAPLQDFVLRAEYFQSYPTFDAFSIYSVFAVDQYKEVSVAAEYQLNSKYRVSVKYAREDFNNSENADVYGIGVLAHPVKGLTINATYENRVGYAGNLSGFRFFGEYKIARASILAGIDYDDFRREDSREGTAKKYWIGANCAFSKNISAVLRIENNSNYTYDHSFQGIAAVNVQY